MSRAAAPPTAPQLGGFLLAQRHRGACTEQTAALFFDDATISGRAATANHEAAKAICRLCPILHPCRSYARADPTLEGIWGGETQTERHTARRKPTGLPVADNEQGRRLASLAAQHAHRDGLDAAAAAFKVPPTTLGRVLGLYGLDQPPGPPPLAAPKGGEPPWPPPRQPPAASTPSSRRWGRRSSSSSPSRAGPPPADRAAPTRPTTPATPSIRPPDQPPIPQQSHHERARQGAST